MLVIATIITAWPYFSKFNTAKFLVKSPLILLTKRMKCDKVEYQPRCVACLPRAGSPAVTASDPAFFNLEVTSAEKTITEEEETHSDALLQLP